MKQIAESCFIGRITLRNGRRRLIDSEKASKVSGELTAFARKFDLKISVWISVNVNQNVAGIEFTVRSCHETAGETRNFFVAENQIRVLSLQLFGFTPFY
jgi:hypothetical protein